MDDPLFDYEKLEESSWYCELFGGGSGGLIFIPVKGGHPCWFHRIMQYLILGNKWIKKDDNG